MAVDVFAFLWTYFFVSATLSAAVYLVSRLLVKFSSYIQWSDSAKEKATLALLLATSLTFLWYSISITLTIYNKWFMTIWRGGFNYPLLSTSIHMFVKLLLTRMWFVCSFSSSSSSSSPAHGPLATPTPTDEPTSPPSSTFRRAPTDTWQNYLLLVIPIGLFTSIDVSLSNQALVYIPVSLYTTIKASVPAFTYVFSVCFGLEIFKGRTFFCVLALAGCLGAAVLSATHISLYGVYLCAGAAVTSGLRWVLTQYLVQTNPQENHVIAVLYKISPVAFLSLLPVALLLERERLQESIFNPRQQHLNSNSNVGASSLPLDANPYPSLAAQAFGLCLAGGGLSSALIFSEITLLNATSSISFSVLGQVKEIVQIILAMIVFGENLSTRSVVAITCSVGAAAYYRQIKVRELRDAILKEGYGEGQRYGEGYGDVSEQADEERGGASSGSEEYGRSGLDVSDQDSEHRMVELNDARSVEAESKEMLLPKGGDRADREQGVELVEPVKTDNANVEEASESRLAKFMKSNKKKPPQPIYSQLYLDGNGSKRLKPAKGAEAAKASR